MQGYGSAWDTPREQQQDPEQLSWTQTSTQNCSYFFFFPLGPLLFYFILKKEFGFTHINFMKRKPKPNMIFFFFIGKGFSQLSICDSVSLFSGSQYLSVENTLGKASLGCITHIHINKIITIVLKSEFSDLSFLCRSLHLCPPSFCTSISYSFLTEVTEIKGLLWLIIQESPTF